MLAIRAALLACCVFAALAVPAPAAPLRAASPAAPAHAQPTRAPAKAGAAAKPDRAPQPQPAGAGEPALVGYVNLSGPLTDGPPPFVWSADDVDPSSMRFVTDRLREAAHDPAYKGLVIFLDQPDLDLSQVDELALTIREVRKAGKKVLVFAEHYGLHDYLLACEADQVLLQHKGELELTGLGVEEIYAAGLLEKVGVKADFLQVGRFKGAEEPLTRKGPSPEWDQNFNALFDDLYAQVVHRIALARKLKPEEVERAFADSWSMSDEDYVKRGLVDRLADGDAEGPTAAAFGEEFEWDDVLAVEHPEVRLDNPFALLQLLAKPRREGAERPSIAVINATGPIDSGESGEGDLLFGEPTVGSRTLAEALADARDDGAVKGVVIRIDSPGGSALASEVMWQAVRDAAKVKPVYVSVGAEAASGGYYLASAGQRIYVSPSSLVGSIGVVGGKLALGGLYDKLGLTVTRRSRGPMGDMFNSVEPFTAEQRAALLKAFERTYAQFADRVKQGRGERVRDIEAVAQGRLFTGRQAVANGLADRLGGLQTAIDDLAADVKLDPGDYDVVTLPAPRTLPEYLEDLLGKIAGDGGGRREPGPRPQGAAPSEAAAAVRAALGPRAWRAVRPTLAGVMLLQHERTLLLQPHTIVVR